MDPQFFFFTGENAYALRQELSRWKASFSAKHGPENMEVLQGATQTVASLMDAVAVMPFIAEKRLVLCEGVPKIEKEHLPRVLEAQHPQVVFAVCDPKPDKRLGIVKALLEHAEVKQFDPLPPAQLAAWVQGQAAKSGSNMGPDAVRALLALAGDDQWMLRGEIDKLSAHAGAEITPAHVDLLCLPSGEQVIWRLTDLIGGRRATEALRFFRDRLDRGEDAYGMWVILLNMVKNIAAVRMCLDAGVTDDKSIGKASGVHFFAVRGLLPLARSMDIARVRSLVGWAAAADVALKTGELKYTAERPGELIALVERTILACA